VDVGQELKAPQACETIDEVRAAIDAIDAQIVAAIGRRFQYVQAVTRFKQTREDVHAVERYNAVLSTRREWAEEMYRNLIGHFINHELTLLDLHDTPASAHDTPASAHDTPATAHDTLATGRDGHGKEHA
jgi:isochorismate pyruvate lyase